MKIKSEANFIAQFVSTNGVEGVYYYLDEGRLLDDYGPAYGGYKEIKQILLTIK